MKSHFGFVGFVGFFGFGILAGVGGISFLPSAGLDHERCCGVFGFAFLRILCEERFFFCPSPL